MSPENSAFGSIIVTAADELPRSGAAVEAQCAALKLGEQLLLRDNVVVILQRFVPMTVSTVDLPHIDSIWRQCEPLVRGRVVFNPGCEQ
jgi:hypothetical protein